MASSYPGGLDSFTNPVATDPLNAPAHASQHADVNDAVEAIESTLGTNPQGTYSTVADRLVEVDNAAASAALSASLAAISASAAQTAENDAGVSALLAEDWAVKLVDPVDGSEYSAKFHAQATASLFTAFDARYLGAKSASPSLDNAGQPLTTGALYFDTVSDEMQQYTTASTWTSVTGGGVSGSFISASVIDAKGDLIVGLSDDTVTRLPVGSNDEALVADSSASAGVKWVGVGLTSGKLDQFAATTSSELAGVISDETGSGSLVFSASPALTGVPTAPTAAVSASTTQIATTAFVVGQAASATPIIEGTGTVGTSLRYAREDHVHPSGGGGGTGGSLTDVFMLMGA